ncbi:MAG: ABC transporter ATP-binding protein [Bdellovibrionales bacterium]|nr:ABC transporter ATP-binding protein [Bdellovibrionales bacterium]
MIEVQHLSKKFVDNWALQDTSWKLGTRRSMGLLGPNGAGKSTTMKIITGLLCATDGQVLVDGEDIFHHPVACKKKIGYLPETPPLYDDLNVKSYLKFVCGLKSVPTYHHTSQMDLAIEKMNLQSVAYKPISDLSKGFRQRVGIAQALIGDPPILILDEPSVGLDPQQVFELRKVIIALKTEHTILLSTHVLTEVQEICDDVVILDRGQVKAQGALQEILSQMQPGHSIRIQVQKITKALLTDLNEISGVISIQQDGQWLEVRCGQNFDRLDIFVEPILKNDSGLLAIEKHHARLEDVFIEVTKE